MNKAVSLSIRGERLLSSVGDLGSLKLAQELPEQFELTVAEVAGIIDGMHGVDDPCNNVRGVGSYQAMIGSGYTYQYAQQQFLQGKYNTGQAVEELAGQFRASCPVVSGEEIVLKVYAFWSNEVVADDYKIICPVGRVENKRKAYRRMRLKISVSNVDSVDFGYYVKRSNNPLEPDFKELFWVGGNVVDRYGRAREMAAPRWDGGCTLYWDEVVTSGHIFAEFDTIYDIWDVVLPGVSIGNYSDYSATVTALWQGSPVELALDVPAVDDEESVLCGGFSDIVDAHAKLNGAGFTDVGLIGTAGGGAAGSPLSSPWDGGGWSRCDEDCGEPCTSSGYTEICCYPPPHVSCVPRCLEYRRVNTGDQFPGDGIEGLRQRYGGDVVFAVAPVNSEDGTCGDHVDRLDVSSRRCCDEFDDINIVEESSSEIIAPNGQGVVVWENGRPPFKVKVKGYDFWVDPVKRRTIIETHSLAVKIFAGPDACGVCDVVVSDGCNVVSHKIRCTVGQWVLSDLLNPGPSMGTISTCILGDVKREEGWRTLQDCSGDELCAQSETWGQKCPLPYSCESGQEECCCITWGREYKWMC